MSTTDDVLGVVTARATDGDLYVRAADIAATLEHLSPGTVRNAAYDLVRRGVLCTGVYTLRGVFRGSPRRVFWLPDHDDAVPDYIARTPPPSPPNYRPPRKRAKPISKHTADWYGDEVLLPHLRANGPTTLAELSRDLHRSHGDLRAMADRLLAKGLITAQVRRTPGKRGRPPTVYAALTTPDD